MGTVSRGISQVTNVHPSKATQSFWSAAPPARHFVFSVGCGDNQWTQSAAAVCWSHWYSQMELSFWIKNLRHWISCGKWDSTVWDYFDYKQYNKMCLLPSGSRLQREGKTQQISKCTSTAYIRFCCEMIKDVLKDSWQYEPAWVKTVLVWRL